MAGLKPAVIGLIGTAVLSVGKTVFFPQGFSTGVLGGMSFYISLAIFLLMTVLAFKKVHPILLICLSAVIGICAESILFLPCPDLLDFFHEKSRKYKDFGCQSRKIPPAPTNLKSSGYWGKISRPWFSLPALSLRLGHPRILNESDQLARQHHR